MGAEKPYLERKIKRWKEQVTIMEKRYIPLSVPNLKGNELKYVIEAVTSEWVSTAGPYISKFEEKLAAYVRMPSAVACQSGTSGLHLAMQVVGVRPGDEVIVPTLTFIAAVNPVRYLGGEPVFMDCDDSLSMDPEKLREFLEKECIERRGRLINRNSGKRIAAIVVVHVFGNLANMQDIMEIAKQYGLPVVEDATEALGSYYMNGVYKGAYAGTIADIGVYSFNGNKIITTGGGGMIVSRNNQLLERCRFLSTQAKKDVIYFEHEEIGYNYRMTNLQAALGLAQLEQLEKFIQTKKKNYEKYLENGLTLLPFRENCRVNYWFYSCVTKDRDKLIQYLEKNQVQSRPIWKLIHMLKPYEGSQSYKIEKALSYYDKVVNIPCSSGLLYQDVERISKLILNYENSEAQ